ncbi:S-layer homology domain-containing protein [Bacillus sp. E(2018)]|uniref:S-layer homology domain-containing protein n=1 Tax=Bacillus sp. E(2018) TaxID=2502239 RepID=UPI0014856085|nr:S-layer homology domain-containing protein [Bacillus sp. E(2018)]
MRKWIALLLLPFVLLISSNSVRATDDISGHYFEKDMRSLIELGYLTGEVIEGQTFYQPDRNITRAEFASLLVRILGAENLEVINPKTFSDVKAGIWYEKAIQQAVEMNIVSGTSSNTFSPGEPITREAMAAMIDRAFEYKGITLPEAELTFTDTSTINEWAMPSVKRMVYAKIIAGNADQTFRPQDQATRGTTSAFLVRMIGKLENPPAPPVANFYLATVTKDQTTKVKEYETYDAAKAAATQSNHVVLKDDKVVYMKSGVVSPAQVHPLASILYMDHTFDEFYYNLVAGTETEFLDAGETWVKVKFNNTIGYFKMNEATLHPTVQLKGASYYKAVDGDLWHYTYNVNTNKYGAFRYGSSGKLPNGNYISKNGHTYTGSGQTYEMYQYFNVMPLYTKTSYTAEQLNNFVKNNKPADVGSTPLETLGKALKDAEAKYNVNAMYILAHAISESDWGTSELAVKKRNLFGLKAYDGSAYESGDIYKSYEACIEELVKGYLLDPTSSYFINGYRAHGEVVGDKEIGMNVRYASDPYWGQKLAGFMYRIDKYLGGKERNAHEIAVTLESGVNVRSDATAKVSNILYKVPKAGTPVLVLNKLESKSGEGTWLQIAPKNLNGANYGKAFVYSHGGSYGTLMKLLPLAK